ncbi:L-rhamnose mutarotase [Tsukamurella hominis]|uniref:L-rhamnose mutarotase n=1 Tax=Tsukamurella hominis TaxID=1970232 RepID=UPI0039EC6B53
MTTHQNTPAPTATPAPSVEQAQAAVDSAEHELDAAWADHVREVADTFPNHVADIAAQVRQGSLPYAPLPTDRAADLADRLTAAARTIADKHRDHPLPPKASLTVISMLRVIPDADLNELGNMLDSAGLSRRPFTVDFELHARTWPNLSNAHREAGLAHMDLYRARKAAAADPADNDKPQSTAAQSGTGRAAQWNRFFDELQQISDQMRQQLRATYRQLITSNAPAEELDRVERLLGHNAELHSHAEEIRESMNPAILNYDRTHQ